MLCEDTLLIEVYESYRTRRVHECSICDRLRENFLIITHNLAFFL